MLPANWINCVCLLTTMLYLDRVTLFVASKYLLFLTLLVMFTGSPVLLHINKPSFYWFSYTLRTTDFIQSSISIVAYTYEWRHLPCHPLLIGDSSRMIDFFINLWCSTCISWQVIHKCLSVFCYSHALGYNTLCILQIVFWHDAWMSF